MVRNSEPTTRALIIVRAKVICTDTVNHNVATRGRNMKYKAWSINEEQVGTVIYWNWKEDEITVEFKGGITMMDDASEFIIIGLGE